MRLYHGDTKKQNKKTKQQPERERERERKEKEKEKKGGGGGEEKIPTSLADVAFTEKVKNP